MKLHKEENDKPGEIRFLFFSTYWERHTSCLLVRNKDSQVFSLAPPISPSLHPISSPRFFFDVYKEYVITLRYNLIDSVYKSFYSDFQANPADMDYLDS